MNKDIKFASVQPIHIVPEPMTPFLHLSLRPHVLTQPTTTTAAYHVCIGAAEATELIYDLLTSVYEGFFCALSLLCFHCISVASVTASLTGVADIHTGQISGDVSRVYGKLLGLSLCGRGLSQQKKDSNKREYSETHFHSSTEIHHVHACEQNTNNQTFSSQIGNNHLQIPVFR